jgi:uncharacterized protein (TIGR02145 family)
MKDVEDCEEHKEFKSVKIGEQIWAQQNLNVSHFKNGDEIPEAKTVLDWKKLGEERKPAWCYYDTDPENGTKYGKLYNWYAVGDIRGLAPPGWHIPTKAEWKIFIYFVDIGPKIDLESIIEFGAQLGGYCFRRGPFRLLGKVGMWWSSTEDGPVAYAFDGKWVNMDDKSFGFSVRCLKD